MEFQFLMDLGMMSARYSEFDLDVVFSRRMIGSNGTIRLKSEDEQRNCIYVTACSFHFDYWGISPSCV